MKEKKQSRRKDEQSSDECRMKKPGGWEKVWSDELRVRKKVNVEHRTSNIQL